MQKVASEGHPKVLVPNEPVLVTDGSGCERTSEDSDPTSLDMEEEPDARVDSLPAPTAVVALSTPVDADVSPGPSIPGISTFSLSPSINLLLHQCTLVGHDWVEGLKKLSLSGPLDEVFVSLIDARARVSSDLVGVPVEPILDLSAVNSPLTTEPEVPPEPGPGKGVESLVSSSPESSESGYFLRSYSKKSGGGLGKEHQPVRKGRGRISHLSKAQPRAKNDLREGKQLSIERALRAVNARKLVKK